MIAYNPTPHSFRDVFWEALERTRAWMRPSNAPRGKAQSAGVAFDVVVQFNWDQLSQTDHVRVLKVLDGGMRTTRVSADAHAAVGGRL